MPQKVILDVDSGGDDAVAIMAAGHHPGLDLQAVCVCFGNAPLSRTLENTLRTISLAELEQVPVYAGSEDPLIGPVLDTLPIQHGLLPFPETALSPQAQHAVNFLVDYYSSKKGPETIYVPVGPLTNLALALRLAPVIKQRIPRIVMMGGAYIEGNTTPSAEFNIMADPEAAQIVFSSGIPITMVGLEVTAQALITPDEAREIRALNTPWAEAAGKLIEENAQWFIDHLGWKGGQIFDACTIAAVIDPQVLTTKPMRVEIELNGVLTRGRTVADISGFRKKMPNVDVGVEIDTPRFIDILKSSLQ
jgi:inosine-uridine nucleoside N-ribohydrolase